MMFDIEALERQVREDDRRVREQVRQYEAYHAEIQLRIDLAVLEYSMAMASCWALALRPAFEL